MLRGVERKCSAPDGIASRVVHRWRFASYIGCLYPLTKEHDSFIGVRRRMFFVFADNLI